MSRPDRHFALVLSLLAPMSAQSQAAANANKTVQAKKGFMIAFDDHIIAALLIRPLASR